MSALQGSQKQHRRSPGPNTRVSIPGLADTWGHHAMSQDKNSLLSFEGQRGG